MIDFMSEYNEDLLSPEEREFQDNFELPRLTYDLIQSIQNNIEDDPFDVLIRISRSSPSNLIPRHSKYDDYIFGNTGVLFLTASSGDLDKAYFSNPSINGEKLKLIVTNFEDIIDDALGRVDEHKRQLAKWIIRHLQGVAYCLSKYNRREIPFKYKEVEVEIQKAIEEKVDTRVSTKAPTNQERIKALKYLAPELWEKLQKQQSKPLQQDVIHLITGVNRVDSYKYSFGDRQKQAEEKDIPNLTDLINKLTQP